MPTSNSETVFSLKDLVIFYEQYAKFDESIRTFCEKVTELVKLGEHQSLIHSFQIHKISNEFGQANLVVIAFDLN